jgi:hypothetical protein
MPDETDNATHFLKYICMSNLAIWVNGTEIVHDTPNSISNVTAVAVGPVEHGNIANAFALDVFSMSFCADEGIRYVWVARQGCWPAGLPACRPAAYGAS